MASIFAHGFAAYAFGQTFSNEIKTKKFWLLGVLCAVLPDADVVITNPTHYAVAIK